MSQLSPRQITLIQQSFDQVSPIRDKAAAIFYARLFEIAPQVRPYFKGDMTAQGAKLMATLGAVVVGLDELDRIVPVAQSLAVRHVDYGVQQEDYAPVGEALIYALAQGLGTAFTTELKESWITAYGILSAVMIDAAYPKAKQ